MGKQKIDLDQELVKKVSKVIPCIHMNADAMACNSVAVFLGFLKYHRENGSTLEDVINDIKVTEINGWKRYSGIRR